MSSSFNFQNLYSKKGKIKNEKKKYSGTHTREEVENSQKIRTHIIEVGPGEWELQGPQSNSTRYYFAGFLEALSLKTLFPAVLFLCKQLRSQPWMVFLRWHVFISFLFFPVGRIYHLIYVEMTQDPRRHSYFTRRSQGKINMVFDFIFLKD